MGHDATLAKDAQAGAPDAGLREQSQTHGQLPNLAPPEMAQFLAQRPDREALLMQLHQTRGNSYVQQVLAASPDQDGDDDVIKVDSDEVLTPNERSAHILSRMTKADAQTARRELRTTKRFAGKLEREFHAFCTAYGLTESAATRRQFVAFLGQAGLTGKKSVHTVDEASGAAKAVFFQQVTAGAKITMDTVGARDVFDARIALTDEEREKLRGITLADGKNALAEREAAEKAWETKQYDTTLDAKSIYATHSPHLAAFQMAARNAGYNTAEIAMAAEGKDNAWLWHYTQQGLFVGPALAEMPATYAEFVTLFGKNPMRRDTLDCHRLEDARMAIAAGQTLAQFDAARGTQPAGTLGEHPRNATDDRVDAAQRLADSLHVLEARFAKSNGFHIAPGLFPDSVTPEAGRILVEKRLPELEAAIKIARETGNEEPLNQVMQRDPIKWLLEKYGDGEKLADYLGKEHHRGEEQLEFVGTVAAAAGGPLWGTLFNGMVHAVRVASNEETAVQAITSVTLDALTGPLAELPGGTVFKQVFKGALISGLTSLAKQSVVIARTEDGEQRKQLEAMVVRRVIGDAFVGAVVAATKGIGKEQTRELVRKANEVAVKIGVELPHLVESDEP